VSTTLAELLKGIGPQINSEYQTAAQNQGLLGAGFSHGMEDALQGNTDNLNAMLSKLGSPATLDSHAQEAGDVTHALGGLIPGTSFSREGAAFASAADMLPGTALLQGQENVKSLRAQAITADQGFQNKLAEMAGNLPGDIQTNYAHLKTLALNDAKFRETVRKDNIAAAAKQADQKLAYLKYSTGVNEFNAKQHLAYAKLANQQYNQNRDYQIKLANLGIAQTKLQQTILKNSFAAANGGLKKTQVDKYQSQAQAIAMKSYYGYTKTTTKSGVPGSTPNVGRVTYAEALQNILMKGVPVQLALDALDRIYPAAQRPTDATLAKALGPLDPALLKQAAIEQQGSVLQNHGDYLPTKGAAGGFLPEGAKYTMGRADQGRDIQTAPGAAIVAPGSGYVVSVKSDPGGGGAHFGPGYPVVHFTSGPYAGMTMYIGHTVSALRPGEKFNAGDALSHTQRSGPLNGGAPDGWAEIGFAPGGTPGGFGQKPPF
jgi:hypothetical protein